MSPAPLCRLLVLAPILASAEPSVNFSREILPILSNKCFTCHGPDAKKKDLRLDSVEAATADLGGYRAIDPADPANSEILARLHDADDPMPPEDAEKQLTDAERDLLDRWVRDGGKYEKHWAFVPPVKAPLPEGADGAIDAFVGQKLAAAGVPFAPEADRATLARRAALVLTGLPPEPEQLDAFLQDTDPDAYGKFVDTLLASPRFGEHQARYWLDAVRYGDTHGLHLDNRRGIFPYRDWVVRAFNDNLRFDEFILWQLAGDLLPEPTTDQLIATGFVRMNPSTAEGGAIPAEFQAKNSFDRTENFGTVFLGLSLNCARCHTHKYDPIPHGEYYELMAFFNSTAEGPLDGNAYVYGPVLKVPTDQAAWSEWQTLERELAEAADPAQKKAVADRMEAAKAKFTTTLVAKELDKPRPTHLLERGEYDQPQGEPLQPGVLSVLGELPAGAPSNRLGLARWLTSAEQPLVSRVLINRFWQDTFGYGLVRTPEDFGLQGEQPTHPELLDWLAVEFRESGWDLKHMLRLMVTSRTFRQDSRWRAEAEDPQNRLLARGPRFRLDAEVLRDVGLWASNLLDPAMGGEGVKPYQPGGLWSALAHPGSNTKKYERDKGDALYRRSLYVYWKRTSPHPMMTLFDAPSRESSCVRRSRTSTPLQSLGLLNETQRVEMGRKLAERLLTGQADDQARLALLFKLLASREPTSLESDVCVGLLKQMRDRYAQNPADATALLATGDAARNEALDPAEVAAWTQVAMTVLASDIAILNY